jgi:hypothetical protein
MDASQIRPQMEVVGSDGRHVGVVDGIDGQRIKLTRTDPAAQDLHHYIPLDQVASVEGDKARLTRPAAEVFNTWDSEARGVKPGSPNAGP